MAAEETGDPLSFGMKTVPCSPKGEADRATQEKSRDRLDTM